MGPILGTLNLLSLLICCYVLFQAKTVEDNNVPIIYQFYHGVELSPRIFGVDVKQFTNCRIGMMLWQILILAFLFSNKPISNDLLCNVFLQSFYIYMFYKWETGYFNTLDFTMQVH